MCLLDSTHLRVKEEEEDGFSSCTHPLSLRASHTLAIHTHSTHTITSEKVYTTHRGAALPPEIEKVLALPDLL